MAMEQPQKWPLITNPLNRADLLHQDGRLINAYGEFNSQSKEFDVIKRPAWLDVSGYANVIGYEALGFFVWYRVPDFPVGTAPQVLSITSQSAIGPIRLFLNNTFITNLTTMVSTTLDPPRFDFVPLNDDPSTLYFKQVGTGYMWDGAAATPIVDAHYVSIEADLAPGAAYLNSRVYVVTYQNQVYGSSLDDDVSAWSSLNVILANNTPGYSRGIVRHLQYILVFKSATTEVFYDAGNPPPGSPLSRVDGVRIPFGISNFNTLVSFNDTLFWVGTSLGTFTGDLADPTGVDYRVIMMNGLEPRVISTPPIERLLVSSEPGERDPYGTMVVIPGHRFYVLWGLIRQDSDGFVVPLSLWYDIDQQLWTEVEGIDNIRNASELLGRILYQAADGQIEEADPYTYQDYEVAGLGTPIQVDIYTPNMTFGTAREKYLGAMYFDADKVVGSTLAVRRSDDDYESWSNFRYVDLNSIKPLITDEGSFDYRAYNLRHVSNTKFRIKTIDLQMDIGVL